MDIKDKVIVITGAAQGLGRSFAQDLSRRGARLALVDINGEKLQETLGFCDSQGKNKIYSVNVADETAMVSLFEEIIQDFGTVDVLLNNAGILRDGLLIKKKGEPNDAQTIEKLSLEKWQQVIDVNLTGVFIAGREMAYHLLKQEKPGVIINLSSISKAGNIGQSNYSAAKAGVAGMTVTWAKELAQHGIRVSAIAPGFIKTDMVASIKTEILNKISESIPLSRYGNPQEICDTARFIIENDYLTGRVIEVDGGLRI